MKKQVNLSAISKKLSLSKRTISNLRSAEMHHVMGGGSAYCTLSCHGCGGNSKNCTQNQNTCPGHASCYTC